MIDVKGQNNLELISTEAALIIVPLILNNRIKLCTVIEYKDTPLAEH